MSIHRRRYFRELVFAILFLHTVGGNLLRGDNEDPVEEEDGVHLQGSAYDDDWHVEDHDGGDQDMISMYNKYGENVLPSGSSWTDRVLPLLEKEREEYDSAQQNENWGDAADKHSSHNDAEDSNSDRPFIPYNISVVNTSGYLNRTWGDIQKHYGPKLVWWDQTRLNMKRMLDFSRNGGSNCINTGGGAVPLYEYCKGCDMLEAQYCLWDMRYNVSGNVRPGCEMNHITDGAQPKCCAQYGNINQVWTVRGTTSALGDAMLCLENIGCRDSEYYAAIREECIFNTCNTLFVNERAPATVLDSEARLSLIFKTVAKIPDIPFSHHDFSKTYDRALSSTGNVIEYEREGEKNVPVYYKDGCLDPRGLNKIRANEFEPPLEHPLTPDAREARLKYWKKDSGLNWDFNWRWNRKRREVSGKKGPHPYGGSEGDQVKNIVTHRAKTEDWGGKNYGKFADDTAGDDVSNECGSYGCAINAKAVTNKPRQELKLRLWDDDEVREARELWDWRKLFAGPNARRDGWEFFDDDKYDDEVMLGSSKPGAFWKKPGTFTQIDNIDRDTRVLKRPARCKNCQPSTRTKYVRPEAPCFSGESTVQLESGEHIAFSKLSVGDRILSVGSSGKVSYDDVVFLPHGRNNIRMDFISIEVENGKNVLATPTHLMRTCDELLVTTSSLRSGSCLQTIDGNKIVVSISLVADSDVGIYSAIVSKNEFIVVDGFVASPFATWPIGHWLVHRFYHIHRALYWLAPTLMKSLPSSVISANSVLGGALAYVLDAAMALSTAVATTPAK